MGFAAVQTQLSSSNLRGGSRGQIGDDVIDAAVITTGTNAYRGPMASPSSPCTARTLTAHTERDGVPIIPVRRMVLRRRGCGLGSAT
jgi:hypothetical protein